jgi:hypothetical protein
MKIQELDNVILTETLITKHFKTDEPILLQQGQIGTVVMELGKNMFEVEFADSDGIPYAMETLSEKQLLVTYNSPLPLHNNATIEKAF